MTTFYSVVRYVPDVAAGESINVGVLSWGEGRVHARFLRDKRRAKNFGGRDCGFLREFERWVRSDIERTFGLDGEHCFSESIAHQIAGQWGGMIQLSEARPSMRSPEQALEALATVFLHDDHSKRHTLLDREAAVKQAVHLVRSAVVERFGREGLSCVKKDVELKGKVRLHRFDLVVANDNDTPHGALHAVSFRGAKAEVIDQQVDALAWAIQDVAQEQPKGAAGRFVVYVIPPLKDTNKSYLNAQKTMRAVGASMRSEANMSKWLNTVVAALGKSREHAGQLRAV